jgi:recombinational DNA repair protein (RecF pathway)
MTREYGMVRVLAKGSKRERSAFSGGLEICTLGQMNAIIRPNTELALLTSWDLEEPMMRIRGCLSAYRASIMAVDLIPRLVQDHDPHPEVFDALQELLRFCDGIESGRETQIIPMLVRYQWLVLVAVGAMPIFDHDVLTGEVLEPADVFGFSAQLGGVTQDPIKNAGFGSQSGQTHADRVWRIRKQTVEFFGSLGPTPGIERFNDEPVDHMDRSARLLGSYIQERTGSEIPSMRWLLGK